MSCSICPINYINKHLSRLTYGRAPKKRSNPVITQNRRIVTDLKKKIKKNRKHSLLNRNLVANKS